MKRNNKKIKKNIKTFLNSEEGKILDSDIVKTAVALGIIGSSLPTEANAAVHTNYFDGTSHVSHASHGSHSSHGSHGSHSSHGSHGSH
ncbi:MAG: His-Xaa-Ser repeat protein HxsA4, partial [Elusimicrobiales bacterium]|nr:His-Xaa-Ser repeat protein HxsA4 [Elusimicrobiales bacterium]